MYQTDDMVNGITIKDCFKNLVELAWETRGIDVNLADKFFDILVECLGIDFRLTFEVDKELANGNTTNLILNNFSTLAGCIAMIDSAFKNYSFMVHEGRFSPEYAEYLQQRRNILLELINYQNKIIDKNNNAEDMTKLTRLNQDIGLLDTRIAYVSENLEIRGR